MNEYWFIAVETRDNRDVGLKTEIENELINKHPLEWLCEAKRSASGMRYETNIVLMYPVTEEQYGKYIGLI